MNIGVCYLIDGDGCISLVGHMRPSRLLIAKHIKTKHFFLVLFWNHGVSIFHFYPPVKVLMFHKIVASYYQLHPVRVSTHIFSATYQQSKNMHMAYSSGLMNWGVIQNLNMKLV